MIDICENCGELLTKVLNNPYDMRYRHTDTNSAMCDLPAGPDGYTKKFASLKMVESLVMPYPVPKELKEKKEEPRMKLKVFQWQYDDIEAAVWHMKDSRKWLDENLEVAQYTYVKDFPKIYIFFGSENSMEVWRFKLGFDARYVKHALYPEKLEGLRGIPVRVYDIDGEKKWYHQNYHDPKIRKTLDVMNHMQSMLGIVERID